MELCDLNLDTYLDKQHVAVDTLLPITNVNQIWRIMQDITSGVTFIHSHKETHRDLKPRNSTPTYGA
jgi:serine/threonine protein kinase